MKAFRDGYLAKSQAGMEPLEYPYAFYRPVNTGVDSTYDLDGDGRTGGPADAFGFGQYPGKYGMLVLSKFPIDKAASRTFQTFLWKNQPSALLTKRPDGSPFYGADAWENFRLSSKSHWDVAVKLPSRTLHLLWRIPRRQCSMAPKTAMDFAITMKFASSPITPRGATEPSTSWMTPA